MVQKKQTVFTEMTSEKIEECLNKLSEKSKAEWGTMTAQHMVEHLEYTYRIASSEFGDFEIATPEKYLEKTHDSLYSFNPMPKGHNFPLAEKSGIESLIHSDLDTAKKMLLDAREEYLLYFKENPDKKIINVVFGELNKFEWYLLERKHLNHHFKQFNLLD
jgi:oxepin-CoA hydrolase/3-oxo-5,6-dehydrosuberyl-CoA semialdehyde dehydrogenase